MPKLSKINNIIASDISSFLHCLLKPQTTFENNKLINSKVNTGTTSTTIVVDDDDDKSEKKKVKKKN